MANRPAPVAPSEPVEVMLLEPMAKVPPMVRPPAPMVEAMVVLVAKKAPKVGVEVETTTPLPLTANMELIGKADSVVLPETDRAVKVPREVMFG